MVAGNVARWAQNWRGDSGAADAADAVDENCFVVVGIVVAKTGEIVYEIDDGDCPAALRVEAFVFAETVVEVADDVVGKVQIRAAFGPGFDLAGFVAEVAVSQAAKHKDKVRHNLKQAFA